MQEIKKWKEKSQKLEQVRTRLALFIFIFLFLVCQDFENLKNRIEEFENQKPKVRNQTDETKNILFILFSHRL